MMLVGVVLALLVLGMVVAGAPYVPTHRHDLEILFSQLGKGQGQRFLDCGAGDGRVVAMAAAHGYQAVGYEINPLLWLVANIRLARTPHGSVRFGLWQRQELGEYDVVYFFGTEPHLQRALKGRNIPAMIVSYGFRPAVEAARAIHQTGPFWVVEAKK